MTAANVEFLNIYGEPAGPDQKPARFTFRCVGYNRDKPSFCKPVECAKLLIAEGPYSAAHGVKHDPRGENGGRPQWTWDGNRDAPTFSPSVNCAGHCGWHGYIRNGRCVDTNGRDEP